MKVIDIKKSNKKHSVDITFYIDTMLAIGIAIGYDDNVRPTEFIFEIVLICFQLRIAIR